MGGDQIVIQKLGMAVELAESLKSENQHLKIKVQETLDKNREITVKYEALIQEYEILCYERSALQEENGAAIEELKHQLNATLNEFESFKDASIKQDDLDLLKLKLQKEIADKFAAQIKAQDQEIETYRDNFYDLRREHEILEAEYKNQAKMFANERLCLNKFHQEEILSLQEKLLKMDQSLADTSEIERMRKLQRELTSAQTELSVKTNQFNDASELLEQLKNDWDQKERLFQRQVSELSVSEKNLIADKDSLMHRVKNLEFELRQSNDKHDMTVEENHRLKIEIDRLKVHLDDINHKCSNEVAEMRKSVLLQISEKEDSLLQLSKQISAYQSQIAALTSLSEQSKTTLAEMETNNLQILHKTKESDAKIITKLEAEKLQLHNEVSQLQKSILNSNSAQSNHVQNELSSLRAEIDQMALENQGLEQQIDKLKRESQEHEMEKQNLLLQVSNKDDNQRTASRDRQALKEQFTKEKMSYDHNLERYKTLLTKERYNFKKHQEVWEDEKKQLQVQITNLSDDLLKTKRLTKQKIARYKTKYRNNKDSHQNSEREPPSEDMAELLKKQAQFLELLETEGVFKV